MKRKTIIQLTAALAAVGLVMIGVDRNTSKVAFAAFEGVEGSSEFIDTAEYAEEQAAAPVVLETENVISSEEMEAPLEEKTTGARHRKYSRRKYRANRDCTDN